jgi:hypothetical protein
MSPEAAREFSTVGGRSATLSAIAVKMLAKIAGSNVTLDESPALIRPKNVTQKCAVSHTCKCSQCLSNVGDLSIITQHIA